MLIWFFQMGSSFYPYAGFPSCVTTLTETMFLCSAKICSPTLGSNGWELKCCCA